MPGLSPYPVQASLDRGLSGEVGEKAVFSGKHHNGKTEDDCENALSRQKQHGHASEKKRHSGKVTQHEPENRAWSGFPTQRLWPNGMSGEEVMGQFADQPGNDSQADKKGTEREKAQPVQNRFEYFPVWCPHTFFGEFQ